MSLKKEPTAFGMSFKTWMEGAAEVAAAMLAKKYGDNLSRSRYTISGETPSSYKFDYTPTEPKPADELDDYLARARPLYKVQDLRKEPLSKHVQAMGDMDAEYKGRNWPPPEDEVAKVSVKDRRFVNPYASAENEKLKKGVQPMTPEIEDDIKLLMAQGYRTPYAINLKLAEMGKTLNIKDVRKVVYPLISTDSRRMIDRKERARLK